MALDSLPHLTFLGGALVLFVLSFQLVSAVTTWRRRRAMKQEYGCLDALSTTPWYDPYGILHFLTVLGDLKEHRVLERGQQRLRNTGAKTVQRNSLGSYIHETTEPENLKVVQATEFKKWGLGSRRKLGFRPLLGEGIFTNDGAAWQHSREMLRPNFVRSQVGDLATFETHISHLIARLPRDGSTVDLGPLFFSLTIDSATEFLFGTSTHSLIDSSTDGFAEAFNYSQEYIANRARWGRLSALFPANKRFETDRAYIFNLIDGYIDRALAARGEKSAVDATTTTNTPTRYVFLDELIRQTDDKVKIRSELLNILLAGRDTTASLLTNVWFLLSKRPDVWHALQRDVARLDPNRPPTFESLKDLKYLRALLNETLRLYPVVPLNSREALEDTVLPRGGGSDGRAPIFIPRGGVLAWNVYGLHRRPDFYGPDADHFRPERWLDDDDSSSSSSSTSDASSKKGLRPGWEYLPFNGGARICLGQQFALTEASYTTVRLCQTFAGIESKDPETHWRESLTLTCVNLNGAKVALTPRN